MINKSKSASGGLGKLSNVSRALAQFVDTDTVSLWRDVI